MKSDHKYLVEAQKVQCTTKHNYTINNFQQQKNILKSVYKITGDEVPTAPVVKTVLSDLYW